MRHGVLLFWLAACGGSPPPEANDASDAVDAPEVVEDAPEAPPDVPLACTWSESRDVAVVADPMLTEISGMVASRIHDGVLYVHNDSGEAVARFFALQPDGTTLAQIVIDGAPSLDTEDAALETSGGREWLWLGDIGDNAARDGGTPRSSIDVIRAEVPALPSAPSATPLHVASHELFTLTYPDAPHDCEALIFDAPTGDLYLLSKENEGPHRVYRAAAPHVAGTNRVLEPIGEILPGRSLADAITAADGDARGRFVVRTYRRVYLFEATTGTPAERWSVAPLELPVIRELQGEAIAFFADGHGVYTVAEGDAQTIHALDETCP